MYLWFQFQMSKNEFEMDFKKSFFLEVRSENGCENDIFRSYIGLGFGERGGTPPSRIPRVPPGR